MKTTFAFLTLAALAAPTYAADTWSIDPTHSEASFQVRHMVTQVRGNFAKFEGTIVADTAKPESSSVDFKIDVASINTGLADRDKHLQSPDFFDAATYPAITFKSKSIKATGKDAYAVSGTLTLRGVAKEVTLPVTFLGAGKDPWGNERAGFETSLTVNRKEYGINWNKALDQGGFILGDDVKVTINIEAIKQKATASN